MRGFLVTPCLRGGEPVQQRNGSRRKFLQGMGALGVVVATAPYVKTSHSAGKLAIGTWDHWVPGANDVLREVCEEWAGSNGVDLTIDFITSIGNKLLLTAQAESRACLLYTSDAADE